MHVIGTPRCMTLRAYVLYAYMCDGYMLLTCNIELSTCRVYSYDVSMCRDWSVDASGVHENNPRERPNHGAETHGLGVKLGRAESTTGAIRSGHPQAVNLPNAQKARFAKYGI